VHVTILYLLIGGGVALFGTLRLIERELSGIVYLLIGGGVALFGTLRLTIKRFVLGTLSPMWKQLLSVQAFGIFYLNVVYVVLQVLLADRTI
jgi:hypothetical protein